MNALTLTLIRVAFLAVLWLFVIAAIGVVRTDLLGTVAAKAAPGTEPASADAAAQAAAAGADPDGERRASLSSPRAACQA